ncbi:16S rRNA (guanine(527)-N(7))-methyltransferase RsmG [Limibacter armeniacum]|uniref:16S rRNA (guanine(527)-N(7))-methyltransferase RsmG n=1 Tax=Limibacter armeniacum TaxID=466084 RepID=UPI002FE5BD91
MEIINKYFPDLTEQQKEQFSKLQDLYSDLNEKVNVVSRKDIQNLYERHVLHSLGIAQKFSFKPGTKILDVGTGGGFPGIPLAIMFPEVQFHLVDSIGKKIWVVNEVAAALGLKNVTAEQVRAEKVKDKYDFVVSRAVTRINVLFRWIQDIIKKEDKHDFHNGLICLKGGDLKEEFAKFKRNYRFYDMADFYEEEFFETKKVVYVPAK